MKINIKSILTSGLVAGLIIIVSAISMVPAVGNEMDLVLAHLGLPPLSNLAMLYFCIISLIFGFLLVALYAIVKEQFGAGIKTAVIVAIAFWFPTYFLSNLSLVAYGFMPLKLTLIGSAWGLGELIIAGIVGSKLYKDVK